MSSVTGKAIDEDMVRSFVWGIGNFFSKTSRDEAEVEAPYLLNNLVHNDFTGVIGVSGDQQGAVYFTVPRALLIDLYGNQYSASLGADFDGLSESEYNELLADSAGEMANTVSGNVRNFLGENFLISTPVVFTPSRGEFEVESINTIVMNSFFDYRTSGKPLASQKLTSIHWECYHAIREKHFEEFLDTQLKEEHGQLVLAKVLVELETMGLLLNEARNLKDEQWVSEKDGSVELSGSSGAKASKAIESVSQEIGENTVDLKNEKEADVKVSSVKSAKKENSRPTGKSISVKKGQKSKPKEVEQEVAISEESIDVREKKSGKRLQAVSIEL